MVVTFLRVVTWDRVFGDWKWKLGGFAGRLDACRFWDDVIGCQDRGRT